MSKLEFSIVIEIMAIIVFVIGTLMYDLTKLQATSLGLVLLGGCVALLNIFIIALSYAEKEKEEE